MKPARTTIVLTTCMLMLLPSALAVHDSAPVIHDVVFDLFDDIDVTDLDYEPGCDGGAFEINTASNSFRFFEVPEGTENLAGDPTTAPTGGQESTGCGTASMLLPLPSTYDHFHVRFFANREITEFPINSGINLVQTISALAPSGAPLEVKDYFEPGAGDEDEVFIDPSPSFHFNDVGAREEVTVEWYFEDEGFGAQQQIPNFLSGVGFASTIRAPEIEISGVPIPGHSITVEEDRQGNNVVDRYTITSDVSESRLNNYDRVSVRIVIDEEVEFDQAIMPDGTIVDITATRAADGVFGYDPNMILEERFDGSRLLTIPYGLVAQHGAGEYTFIVTESQGLTVQNALIPIAIAMGLLPLAASAFAIRGVTRFERESFGGFQRAARYQILAIALLLLYYIGVMVSAWITGAVYRMVTWPFDAAAWLLYLQVAIAALGFIAVFLVGRELYAITVPKDPVVMEPGKKQARKRSKKQ